MTDRAWMFGFEQLRHAGLPGWPEDQAEAHRRAGIYRLNLDDLTDEQWLHAVQQAIQRERWFPVVAALRTYAEQYQQRALSYGPRSPEQIEADREARRENTRRMLEAIRAELAQRGVDVGGLEPIVKPMPQPASGEL